MQDRAQRGPASRRVRRRPRRRHRRLEPRRPHACRCRRCLRAVSPCRPHPRLRTRPRHRPRPRHLCVRRSSKRRRLRSPRMPHPGRTARRPPWRASLRRQWRPSTSGRTRTPRQPCRCPPLRRLRLRIRAMPTSLRLSRRSRRQLRPDSSSRA